MFSNIAIRNVNYQRNLLKDKIINTGQKNRGYKAIRMKKDTGYTDATNGVERENLMEDTCVVDLLRTCKDLDRVGKGKRLEVG